jgi:predicted PurR-regulated permease PerM
MNRPPTLQRLIILGLSGPVVALNVWLVTQLFSYFDHLITLLITSAIFAFLLNYAVRFFERARITRTQSVILVLLITCAVVGILGITLVPLVIEQTNQLLIKIPGWLESSRQNFFALDDWAKGRNLALDLRGLSGRINAQIEGQLETVAKQALTLALGTLTWLVDGILVLVLAFYMLLYGDQLWYGLINLLPAPIGLPLSESLRLNFQNFFISQLLLALFMAIVLIPAFLVMGVPFTLLFAILIGIAELIPFVGAALGIGLVSLILMLQDPGLGFRVALVCTLIQQFRDNIIAPRMMGSFTGLNPIWIFIALLLGLQIAGFLGVIIAVPIAGTIKGTLDIVRNSNLPVEAAELVRQEPLDGE